MALPYIRDTADGFAAVYNATHRQAVRLAWLLCGDAHQAEDIVADVYAKVWVAWKAGRVDNPEAYIRRAVVNETNSKLRRRYLERREASKRHGDDRGIRRVDEDAADRDAIFAALMTLPSKQRAAIVLRYYEDLTETQTAAVLGCSVGTVKSQVSRGLDRLRATVGAEVLR